MKIEAITVTEALRISGLPDLDPITVILQDTDNEQGQIWVECYGNAWASWWGAMGNRTVREFVASSDPGYLASSLMQGRMTRTSETESFYVTRIATAVINALKAA